MPQTFRRKRNRLPLEVYGGARAYSLTLTCAQRDTAFTDDVFVAACLQVLRSCSQRHQFAVLAYCFMPDHLHLLVEGSDRSDLQTFVKDFKQRTGYTYRRLSSKPLWQKSYYDHVLRREEDVRQVARYIVANPVRAGLVETAEDYSYSGSFRVWESDYGSLKASSTPSA